jgi:hypothetical protein
MAPRLHRHAHHDQEEDQNQLAIVPMHGDGTPIPVHHLNEVELAFLLDLLGVNELAGVDGAEDRTVKLSDRSEVVCPAHGRLLKPDACRSCWFLDPTRPRE